MAGDLTCRPISGDPHPRGSGDGGPARPGRPVGCRRCRRPRPRGVLRLPGAALQVHVTPRRHSGLHRSVTGSQCCCAPVLLHATPVSTRHPFLSLSMVTRPPSPTSYRTSDSATQPPSFSCLGTPAVLYSQQTAIPRRGPAPLQCQRTDVPATRDPAQPGLARRRLRRGLVGLVTEPGPVRRSDRRQTTGAWERRSHEPGRRQSWRCTSSGFDIGDVSGTRVPPGLSDTLFGTPVFARFKR